MAETMIKATFYKSINLNKIPPPSIVWIFFIHLDTCGPYLVDIKYPPSWQCYQVEKDGIALRILFIKIFTI